MISTLHTQVKLEANALRASTTHKIWGQIELKPSSELYFDRVDLVVAIDISASMAPLLPMIQWMVQSIFEGLKETSTISLITFNHTVSNHFTFLPCTRENKSKLIDEVNALHCEGSTNIVDCLIASKGILDSSVVRCPRVIVVITDGLHHFIPNSTIIDQISNMTLPYPVYTFGVGRDQGAGLLHTISHRTKGVYQNIQTSDQVPMIVESFTRTIQNIYAKNICIMIECHDGSRIVTLATSYEISEEVNAKKYNITIPFISKNQTKTILFRLSLRKMENPMKQHQLMTVKILADYPSHSLTLSHSGPFSVERPAMALLQSIPNEVNYSLNRYATAVAITEALNLADKYEFDQAINKITITIADIRKSYSENDMLNPELIKLLEECKQYLKNKTIYDLGGAHASHMIVSELYMEYKRTIPLTKPLPTSHCTFIASLAYADDF